MPVYARLAASRSLNEKKFTLLEAKKFGYEGDESFVALRGHALDAMNLPSFWDYSVMSTDEVVEGSGLEFDPADKVNLVAQVELGDEELENIQRLLDTSFRKRYTRDRRGGKVPDRLKVRKGVRVQNAQNWVEYKTRQEEIRRDLEKLREDDSEVVDSVDSLKTAGCLPDSDLYQLEEGTNSAWLFHGTTEAAAECICRGDFRVNLAGSNAGTLFGHGVYLAESCSKSDEYSSENDDGLRCLLVCRAVLGNVNYCDEKRPDVNDLVNSCVCGPFHSVLGDREKVHNTFREFIVYDDNQVYPEYIVWYTRVYT